MPSIRTFPAARVLVSAVMFFAGTLLLAQTTVPHSSHVVLIVEENTGYNTTVATMPWLVSQGNAYGHTTNYFSDTSGSLMDYLWLASGSCESSANCALPAGTNNFGCNGNNCASPITDDSIWAEMDRLGITWKVYAQSYAAAGGTVTTPDNANGTSYYRRHNGATWYAEILNNVSGSQARIVDFSQFAIDLANNTLPQFSWIIPDGLHDAHDGTPAQADSFLQTNIAPLLSQPYFQASGDGLLLITFDNGDFDVAGLVYTAVIGPQVKPNAISNTFYKHENTLRTMLDALGITNHPGASATVTSMTDFFSSGSVTITSPMEGATTGTQVQVTATAIEPNTQISQLQVWDDTTGQKLAVVNGSSVNQSFTLAAGTHRLIVEDMNTSWQVLHKAAVDITVAGSVTITSPSEGATTGTQVQVVATATEPNTQISQLQVWDDTTGQKLAVVNGSSINQSFTLAPGTHRLIVEDMSTSWQVLHKAAVDITVTMGGVTITSPAESATTGTQVTVIASATEPTQISQLQVWDNTTGTKLGVFWSSSLNQTFTLAPGPHQLIVEDLNTSFQVLHKASVDVTVVGP